MKKVLGIIPARYASTRFPGKPLVDIKGKPMVQHVYERVSKLLVNTVVATDDERIEKAVKDFGGKVLMTSGNHASGTERCFEAYGKYKSKYNFNADVIVNIQGDEPFIRDEHLQKVISCFYDERAEIATLAKLIDSTDELFSPNQPKLVFNNFNEALYFSRSPIPFFRNAPENLWLQKHNYYKHIGIYAYRADILEKIVKLKPTELEKAESLEQLRWLENGFKIKVEITEYDSQSIDTPDDLEKLLSAM